jgi:hypothetical protein
MLAIAELIYRPWRKKHLDIRGKQRATWLAVAAEFYDT